MTDEQIKQNAEEYASKLAPAEKHKTGIPLAINHVAMVSFTEGAHSRDEEINDLQLAYNNLVNSFNERGRELAKASQELNELRNPWISVEERLPEEDEDNNGYSVKVMGMFTNGCISDCFCSLEENIWFIDGLTCDKPTHWMQIPKLKEGE